MTLVLGLGNKARHGKDSFAQAVDAHFAIQHAAAAKHGLTSYKPVIVQHVAFADALYREVNEFLKHYQMMSSIAGIWLPTSGPIQYPRPESFKVGTEMKEGMVLFNAEWYPLGTKMVQIPEWVTLDPNAEKSTRAPYGKHAKLLQWWGTEYRRAQNPNYWVDQWKASINPKANIVLATDMRFLNEAAAVKSVGGFTVRISRKNQDGTHFVDPTRDAKHISERELDTYNYDYQITVKTGDLALLDQWATALVYYLRALKGHK